MVDVPVGDPAGVGPAAGVLAGVGAVPPRRSPRTTAKSRASRCKA